MDIRRALPADLPAVSGIYGREAREGHATFDVEPRPMALWEEKLAATGPVSTSSSPSTRARSSGTPARRPTGPSRPTSTPARAGSTSTPGHQGLGTGRALYDALLALLADDGVHLVVAGVALPNDASLALHRAVGFEEVGTMREVGRKFDRWIDLMWLQKVLA